jgi:hypothetical protein
MDLGIFLLLTGWFGLLIFLIQRTEARRRRVIMFFMAIAAFLTIYWANYRGLGGYIPGSIIVACILNFLFWALIGRYNPVGSSESIQVIGMDD